jgi:hypothetical protein
MRTRSKIPQQHPECDHQQSRRAHTQAAEPQANDGPATTAPAPPAVSVTITARDPATLKAMLNALVQVKGQPRLKKVIYDGYELTEPDV